MLHPRAGHTSTTTSKYFALLAGPMTAMSSSNDWGYSPTIKAQRSDIDAPRSSCESTSTTFSDFLPNPQVQGYNQQLERESTRLSEIYRRVVGRTEKQVHAAWYSPNTKISATEKVNSDYLSLSSSQQQRSHGKTPWDVSLIAQPTQVKHTPKQTTRYLHRFGDVKLSRAVVPDSESVSFVCRLDAARKIVAED